MCVTSWRRLIEKRIEISACRRCQRVPVVAAKCGKIGQRVRDERRFANPDIYDIDRKPKGHLGFGGGVHACLGTAIGRLASKLAFEELHKVVPDYARVQETLPWMPSTTFRSPLRLELTRM